MAYAKLRLDKADVEDAKAMLSGVQNGFVRAYARALNRSVTGVQTDMVSMARDDYAYKVAAVRARMWKTRATWSRLTASVRSRGAGVLLSDFLGTRQISTGLSVDVKRSTGRQGIKHGFLNKSPKSAKLLSLRREVVDGRRSARYPIEALYGPHPEVVWNTEENWDKLQDQADERLVVAFSHEVDYVMSQYA